MIASVADRSTSAPHRLRVGLVSIATLALIAISTGATACPFCNVVTPTFAERRESATVCALAEALDQHAANWRFRVHRVHQGETEVAAGQVIEFDPKLKLQSGDLTMLLGTPEQDDSETTWRWEATPVSIVSYRYFAGAPSLRANAAERLAYFAPFLESAEADIAADAFAELGRAPLDAVEAIADSDLVARAGAWVESDSLPDDRRGGYALLLGLAKQPEDRAANTQVLRAAIEKPREDFRAGFDGILGAYLLLEPAEALTLIDGRYITNTEARPGDTRHALNALRFCMEYHRGPERKEILAVIRHGLARPAFAPEIITDLARWKDWEPLDAVAALYDPASGKDGASLHRAIIGYLKACPDGQPQLDRLRQLDPDGVEQIEQRLKAPLDR